MSNKYDNCDGFRLARTGGAVVITLVLDPFVGVIGSYPTSLPCRGCWIQVREDNSSDVYISTGPNATAEASPMLSIPSHGRQPLWVSIADVGQLSFAGAEGDHIDIVYLTG